MSIDRPAPRHRIVSALVAAVLLAACNPAPPTAAPTATPTPLPSPTPVASQPPAAEVYSAIRKQVETIRGLQPSADVDPVTIDEPQLIKNLTAEFDTENSARDLAFSQDTLIALGLLPSGSSLRDLTLDFQGGQVAGYYSPDKNELFVVSRSGGLGPAEEVTYSHEFTHQLQDQNFDLDKLGTDAANQSDRALAQVALAEGDAVAVQNRWTTENLTPEEMGQLLTASLDPKALEALQRAPAYLRDTSLFPYLSGNPFVETLIAGGGFQAVNDAYKDPPLSTEQILHPEKYAQREAPVEVKLPNNLATRLGAGWTEAGQDTLGEYILRLWLTQNGVPTPDATTAAAGWGGDRLVLLRGPDGAVGVAIETAWDTPVDAAAFNLEASLAARALDPKSAVFADGERHIVIVLGDRTADLARALGA